MKLAALLLACIALGTLAGFAVPRRKPCGAAEPDPSPVTAAAAKTAPSPPDETTPTPPADRELTRTDLKAEIESLRKNPDALTPEEKAARAAELSARLAKLGNASEMEDLIAVMHALAALGKEGFEGAFKALKILVHMTTYSGRDRFLDACDGAVLRMAMWAIGDPEHAPRDSREICAQILARHFDDNLDVGPLILRALASERDEDVRFILAKTFPCALPVPATPTLATAGFGAASSEMAALALARGIATNHWPEAKRDSTLAWLTTSSDPAVAAAATVARIAIHPPVAGVLVERVGFRSATAASGVQPGDIVIAVDGEPLRDIEDLDRAMSHGTNCILRVRRGAQEIDLGINASAYDRHIDGVFVEPR